MKGKDRNQRLLIIESLWLRTTRATPISQIPCGTEICFKDAWMFSLLVNFFMWGSIGLEQISSFSLLFFSIWNCCFPKIASYPPGTVCNRMHFWRQHACDWLQPKRPNTGVAVKKRTQVLSLWEEEQESSSTFTQPDSCYGTQFFAGF